MISTPVPWAPAPAVSIPVPPPLGRPGAPDHFQDQAIPFKSEAGLELLKECAAEHLTALPRVMSHFEVSDAGFQGGVASATMVLNALGLSTRLILDEYPGFAYSTHDSVLAAFAQAEPMIRARGTTLDRLESLLDDCGLDVHGVHVASAGRSEVELFRSRALAAIQDPRSHLLVNFRGLDGRGYHSPVAAYHQGSDRFLIYNVTPPKPQPVWIETEALVKMMATVDPDARQTRGYLLARAEGPTPASAGGEGTTLVSLNSPEGTALLQGCEPGHLNSLPGLMAEHQIQDNLFTCAPTSLSSVANELDLPAPGLRLRQGELEALLPEPIQKQLATPGLGLSLENLDLLATRLGAQTSRTHARPLSEDPEGLDRFRADCVAALESPDSHLIVSFDRKALGQPGGGHFSPVAAYNSQEDRFLIYDTAPYKVDPVWVPAKSLYQAMATFDSDLQAQRGYLKVSNPALL